MKFDTKILLLRLFFVITGISLMVAFTVMNFDAIAAYFSGTLGNSDSLFPGLQETYNDIAVFSGFMIYVSCSIIILWSTFSSRNHFVQCMYPEFKHISSKL